MLLVSERSKWLSIAVHSVKQTLTLLSRACKGGLNKLRRLSSRDVRELTECSALPKEGLEPSEDPLSSAKFGASYLVAMIAEERNAS